MTKNAPEPDNLVLVASAGYVVHLPDLDDPASPACRPDRRGAADWKLVEFAEADDRPLCRNHGCFGERSRRRCPFCGVEIAAFVPHLRQCEEAPREADLSYLPGAARRIDG